LEDLEELVDEAIAQEFGDGIAFDDDDFNNDMTVAESLVPLEEEIQEIEEEGNDNILAEEINEIEEEIEGSLCCVVGFGICAYHVFISLLITQSVFVSNPSCRYLQQLRALMTMTKPRRLIRKNTSQIWRR